jgi:dihydroorotate dehydrogenase electron transfer subunit
VKQPLCTVTSSMEVMPDTYLIWIEAPGIAATAQPGQFVTVKCGDLMLRRPLSVHQSSPLTGEDSGEGKIALLFRVVGKGTLWLSQRKQNEKLDILGPFGRGFAVPNQCEHLLLVAGGIGIAPLAFLMQQASQKHQITLIHGANTAAQLYAERCQLTAVNHQVVQCIPVTEDGTAGRKGMATDILPDFLDWADWVYACGPLDMYKKISLTANRRQLTSKRCQVSLEVRMGCGFGSCYGCTINTRQGLRRVCRDGPVFELDDVIWQEVRI